MQLTDQEIQAMYDQLATLRVPLEPQSIKGLGYVKERLMLCRAMQDRLGELRLKAGRALSWVQEQQVYHKSAVLLTEGQEKAQMKIRLVELDRAFRSHSMLFRLLNGQGSILTRTAGDIRLLADVTVKQLKLGEEGGVNPHEVTENPAENPLLVPADMSKLGDVVPAAVAVNDAQDVEREVREYFKKSDELSVKSHAAMQTLADKTPATPDRTPSMTEPSLANEPTTLVPTSPARPQPPTQAPPPLVSPIRQEHAISEQTPLHTQPPAPTPVPPMSPPAPTPAAPPPTPSAPPAPVSTPISERVPFSTLPVTPSAPTEGLSSLFDTAPAGRTRSTVIAAPPPHVNGARAQTVGFDTPMASGEVEDDHRLQLADHSSVSIDALFEEIAHGGDTRHPAHPAL